MDPATIAPTLPCSRHARRLRSLRRSALRLEHHTSDQLAALTIRVEVLAARMAIGAVLLGLVGAAMVTSVVQAAFKAASPVPAAYASEKP